MNIPTDKRHHAPKKVSAGQIAYAWRDHERRGIPARQLAARLGITVSALRQRWIRAGHYAPAPAPRPLLASEVKAAERAVASGTVTIKDIAVSTGRCVNHLREVLRARGVTRPPCCVPRLLDRDRRVVGMLIDGAPWFEIIAATQAHGPPKQARSRLLQAVLRYCAREAMPVPPATYAVLRPGNWSRRGGRRAA